MANHLLFAVLHTLFYFIIRIVPRMFDITQSQLCRHIRTHYIHFMQTHTDTLHTLHADTYGHTTYTSCTTHIHQSHSSLLYSFSLLHVLHIHCPRITVLYTHTCHTLNAKLQKSSRFGQFMEHLSITSVACHSFDIF